jgi:hypothetical protein
MATDAVPAGIPAANWLPTFTYPPTYLTSFHLSFSKTQTLVDQLLGLQISRWTIATIRQGVQHYLEQAWSAHHCDRSLSSDQ